MLNSKKIIATVLSVIMCFSLTIVSHAEENIEVKSEIYATSFQVDENTLESKARNYDMPIEVKEYIKEILIADENAEITVYSPDTSIVTRGSSSSWSSTRIYKGYTLKDWIVHNSTSTGMKDIKAGSNAYSFANSLASYCGGVLLDSFIPFSSSGLTLAQFILGTNTTIYATGGDKASASVMFTSDTKFTYVNLGGTYELGARTSKAKLETIDWYFYYDKTHTRSYKPYTYNKTYSSSSYNNPDAKAITGTGIGGILENPISLKIGDYTFVLE